MTLQAKPYNPPPASALKVVHVDEQIVVCDKPSGLLSVPGRGPEKAFCASGLLAEFYGEVFVVHRLDMDTSGCMVVARSLDVQRALSRQFEKRQVEKTYHALLEGTLHPDIGTVDAAIAKFSHQRPLRHLDPEGREAITHWRVTERSKGSTRVELTPKTGRSHQLRLHMQHLGHPILGDVFYGDPDSHERLCLHATLLRFDHPATDKKLTLSTPVPF